MLPLHVTAFSLSLSSSSLHTLYCRHSHRSPCFSLPPFSVQENAEYIKSALSMHEVVVVNTEDGPPPGDKKKADLAVPGKPSYHFYVAN